MNVIQYEIEVHKDAEKIHRLAQQNGDAKAYEHAAQLYELCGDFDKARVCYEAAERLSK